jgi:hypothetical protein
VKTESRTYDDEIRALTAKLNEFTTAFTSRWSGPNDDSMDKKYAWKKIPPKSGEPSTKKVHVNGVSKTYYWCPNHQQWTSHPPKDCKRLPVEKGKKNQKNKKSIKRSQFKEKKQAYIQAKAAYEACMKASAADDDVTSNSDNEEDSNKSVSSYFHQKTSMFLDMKGVRSGDQCHLMQPNFTY